MYPKCSSQIAVRQFQYFGSEFSRKFFRIVGIVSLAETFCKLPFALLGNPLVPETADIQPDTFLRKLTPDTESAAPARRAAISLHGPEEMFTRVPHPVARGHVACIENDTEQFYCRRSCSHIRKV